MTIYDQLGMTQENVSQILAKAETIRREVRKYLYSELDRTPEKDEALSKILEETGADLRAFLRRAQEAQRHTRSDPYGISTAQADLKKEQEDFRDTTNDPYGISAAVESNRKAMADLADTIAEGLDRLNKFFYRTARKEEVPENIRVIAPAATEIVADMLGVDIELNLIVPCEKHEATIKRPWPIKGSQKAGTNIIDVRADKAWSEVVATIIHEARHVWQTEVHGVEARKEGYNRMEADAERFTEDKFSVVKRELMDGYRLGSYFEQ